MKKYEKYEEKKLILSGNPASVAFKLSLDYID
jgi:hypothetical protein